MKKFPVTSEQGNEYAVGLCAHLAYNDSVFCEVFVEGKTWYGRRFFKRVFGGPLSGRYVMKAWDYDFVEIAKHAVALYEEKQAKLERHERSMDEGLTKFVEWDGDC